MTELSQEYSGISGIKRELPQGWFFPQDIEYYRETYQSLPDGAITLEIGAWKGRSICSVADIVIHKNITVYIVDTFLGSENERTTFHAEAATSDIEAIFCQNIENFRLTKNIKILKVDTRKLWEAYPTPDNFFDFIFIDGQHTADMVEHDINICLPKLKENCFLAGHDFVLEGVSTGVKKALKGNFSINDNNENIWEMKKETIKTTTANNKKIVLISCWSKPLRNGKWNAKSPSKEYWTKLVKLLKDKGYDVWQCGQGPEIRIKFVDRYLWDKDLWLLGEQILICDIWISPDNFFHHWALLQFKKPGIVIWSQSDPSIFGHEKNTNMLKDKKYLRDKQFELWEVATYNTDAFPTIEEVVKEVEKMILKNGIT